MYRILYARAIEIQEKEIRCYISHNNFHAYRMGTSNLPNSTFYSCFVAICSRRESTDKKIK